MNNCEKCGNPLQPGLTTCPICGTTAKSLDAAITAQPMVTNETIEALDEPPIASAPLQTPNAPVQAQPMDINPAPAAPTPAQPMDLSASQAPVAPSAPLPGGPTFDAPVSAPAPAQPAMFTDAGFDGMSINAATPINQPAAPATPAPQTPVVEQKKETSKKDKKPNNMMLLIIVGIVALGMGVGIGFLMSSSMSPKTPAAPSEEVAGENETSENGYTFKIEDGWTPTTLNGKLVITNKDDDVTLRFSTNSGTFTNINTSNIEVSLSTKQGYTNITTEKTKIGETDVVIVNAQNNDIYIQYYYKAHDINNVMFITAIYETEEAKETNEEKVKAIIESTKYTEEIQNAIEAISPHSQMYDDANYTYFDSFATEETNSNE